jgi:hypothetical protein
MPNASSSTSLGFLTIVHEPSGYLGGYLVTNLWGRPLEFRLSSAVQPSRVQQILYGATLQTYICADLIGKTLVDKTAVGVKLILTDLEPVLDLRQRVEVPVAWLAAATDPLAAGFAANGVAVRPASGLRGPILCHPHYSGDVSAISELLDRIDGNLDLTEPFGRIRDAIGEARKTGVARHSA